MKGKLTFVSYGGFVSISVKHVKHGDAEKVCVNIFFDAL